MKKSNFFILGIAVAYLILFIVQTGGKIAFADKLMATLAIVSASLTFAELLKSLESMLTYSLKKRQSLNQEVMENINFLKQTVSGDNMENINFLKQTVSGDNEEENKIIEDAEERVLKESKQNKRIETANNIVAVVTTTIIIFIYVSSVVRLIIWPYLSAKSGDYNDISTRYTLLAFGLMFISIFINESFSDFKQQQEEREELTLKLNKTRMQAFDALKRLSKIESEEKKINSTNDND